MDVTRTHDSAPLDDVPCLGSGEGGRTEGMGGEARGGCVQ